MLLVMKACKCGNYYDNRYYFCNCEGRGVSYSVIDNVQDGPDSVLLVLNKIQSKFVDTTWLGMSFYD